MQYKQRHRFEQAAVDKVVKYLSARSKPTYVGDLAVAVGYSIERTEFVLSHLIDKNVVRWATTDEKVRMDAPCDGAVVVFVNDVVKTGPTID